MPYHDLLLKSIIEFMPKRVVLGTLKGEVVIERLNDQWKVAYSDNRIIIITSTADEINKALAEESIESFSIKHMEQ